MVRQFWLVLFAALISSAQTPKPQLPSGTSVDANLAYGSHPQTVMDVYTPSAGGRSKRCGVLAIHGGGWIQGNKEGVVNNLVVPWLSKGCVVANVEYRLASVAAAPAAVEDVLRAADWFRRNADRWRVDTDRIVATGMSAGGHLALMVGLTPKSAKLGPTNKVAAVVNFFGITDVEDQLGGPNMQQYAVKWVAESEGRMELARRVSPVSYTRKDVPAVLTIHGTADETVPYEHGVRLTRELRDAGADAEMISVPEGQHGFPKEQLDALYVQIFEFVARRGILKDDR
jgi:acetyl esterase/lipase